MLNLLPTILILVAYAAHAVSAQFDENSYFSGNYGPRPSQLQSSEQSNDVEQKYVNSGQSVLLVCDLPTNMPDGKVLFVKYDSKILSSGLNIIDDIDDDRFEIGQQYAWEWSLKINSISEEDAGIYFCKVGFVTIKQYEIIVRVPPRIKDDPKYLPLQTVKEGSTVQFACFASGTPKPNISWYVISPHDQSVTLLKQHTGSSHLVLDKVTRLTPRFYQCKASNFIPPSDTRNFTLTIEFAPEITIESKMDEMQRSMELNCTIRAYPLTNRYFWRKDGAYIQSSVKTEIRNVRINDYTLISQLTIKYYSELDQGLYECTGENDLRVSKMFYTLKESQLNTAKLMPIGYSNNYRGTHMGPSKEANWNNDFSSDGSLTSTRPPHRRKFTKHRLTTLATLGQDESDIDGGDDSLKPIRKQHAQRNRKLKNKKPELASTISTDVMIDETTNDYNSPYVILIDEYLDEKKTNADFDTNERTSQSSAAAAKAFSNYFLLDKLVMVVSFAFVFSGVYLF